MPEVPKVNDLKVIYYENGNIWYKIYYINGKIHKQNEPAIIEYYESGNIRKEQYLINNIHHRLDGPAIVSYYKDGEIIKQEYCYKGTFVKVSSLEEYLEYVEKMMLLEYFE